MTWNRPSARVRDLIRQSAQIIVNAPPEWLAELDTAVLGANPSIAADPELAGAVSRSNQANLYFWATANVRDPGAPVPAEHRTRADERRAGNGPHGDSTHMRWMRIASAKGWPGGGSCRSHSN